uniref:Uncharacterized protein n=1 Tax=Oncorhynchus mykiss TaxID=8022 RepID=A0A8K9WQ20_ONCMY
MGAVEPRGDKRGTGGQEGPRSEGEEESGEDKEFKAPLSALVQNCTVLHSIVGPACIFLKQGFASSQIVRTRTNSKKNICGKDCKEK